MNCQQARVALLDASPLELRARTGALGEHLASCAACGRAAAAILAQDAALDDALRTLVQPRPSRRAWPRLVALVPLAAAAALALLLTRDGGSYPELLVIPPEVPTTTVVNGADGGDVAVMQTRDPNITVVWNFEER